MFNLTSVYARLKPTGDACWCYFHISEQFSMEGPSGDTFLELTRCKLFFSLPVLIFLLREISGPKDGNVIRYLNSLKTSLKTLGGHAVRIHVIQKVWPETALAQCCTIPSSRCSKALLPTELKPAWKSLSPGPSPASRVTVEVDRATGCAQDGFHDNSEAVFRKLIKTYCWELLDGPHPFPL